MAEPPCLEESLGLHSSVNDHWKKRSQLGRIGGEIDTHPFPFCRGSSLRCNQNCKENEALVAEWIKVDNGASLTQHCTCHMSSTICSVPHPVPHPLPVCPGHYRLYLWGLLASLAPLSPHTLQAVECRAWVTRAKSKIRNQSSLLS